MTPSKYEPGDEPGYGYCATHGYESPCPECRKDAEDLYADWQHDERKERA